MEQEKSVELLTPGEAVAEEQARLAAAPVLENYAQYSLPAKHPTGVLYQGEFETPSDGTAQAVRLHARALAGTGVPVLLRSFSGMIVNAQGVVEPSYITGFPPEVAKEVGHLTTTDIALQRPAIKHVVIRSAKHLEQIIVPRGASFGEATFEQQLAMRDAIYDNTIIYSVWERDRVDPGIVRHLSRVKQCWVPCQQNANLLVKSGVPQNRVHVVPHPYDDADMIHVCTRRPAGTHAGQKRFYSIGRWEPRKGFANLIGAFMLAFKPSDNATLTIKYSGSGKWPGYLTPEDALAHWSNANVPFNGWTREEMERSIKLIDGRMPRSQIVKLHFDHNIYVSSSHGEAFNLSAYDAKLAGNRLVYVPWGGVCDFAGDMDIAIPHQMADAHPSYKWEHGAQWAGYQVDALAVGLRRAEVPESFDRPAGFQERFSMAAVGKKMRDLVDVAAPPILVPESSLAHE